MKLILSRKGFDSSAGRAASPIVEGRPVSMPIPAGRRSPATYGDIGLGDTVEHITKGRIRSFYHCHHDPMFSGSRCAFGQVGASQSHLSNQGVGVGDVFVFWGLFKPLEGGNAHHRIFGFLEVDEVVSLGAAPKPSLQPDGFAITHPHFVGYWHDNNTLYVGPGRVVDTAPDFMRLTAADERRVSRWQVPSWLRRSGLSYHGDARRWGECANGTVSLRAACRRQEFGSGFGPPANKRTPPGGAMDRGSAWRLHKPVESVSAEKQKPKAEFGDFQTPAPLADRVCSLLTRIGLAPRSIVEPTCGQGAFLVACESEFEDCETLIGYDINPLHVSIARSRARKSNVSCEDFFALNWPHALNTLDEPILVVGNPPWVTNSAMAALEGSNLPAKSNSRHGRGIDAITGNSNFDVSEWMIEKLLKSLGGRSAVLAMLCKTAAARRVLRHVWKSGPAIRRAALYKIDARKNFGVGAEACLLVCHVGQEAGAHSCEVFGSLEANEPDSTLALEHDRLVADSALFAVHGHYHGVSHRKWRSGIKHDCTKVMELRSAPSPSFYRNGFGDEVLLEDTFLFPLLKGSDLNKGTLPARYMVVTQKTVGESTEGIADQAPLTWRYLNSHAELMRSRGSLVYRKRPPFAVFGVGDYSFTPWKVAICGFSKKADFRIVAPHEGRPVVLDDTCYFLPCSSEEEARAFGKVLNSADARGFFGAFLFPDAKAPDNRRPAQQP